VKSIKEIANELYDICYDIDRKITGLSEDDAALWAKANSIRHAHTIMAMNDFVNAKKKDKLKVLNASGIACGHQDFSIARYLKNNLNLKIDWKAFESPKSKYLKNKQFKRYLNEFDIMLELSDFSNAKQDELYGSGEAEYDIIIFTEIAEHLDHSTLLNSLKAIRNKLKKDGVMIITTPNLVSLPNRFRILFGNGDLTYSGDGTTNLEQGLYGHIVYYDINRLTRILRDVGFKVDNAYTFTFGHGPVEKITKKRLMIKINNFMSYFFKNSRTNIFMVATKTEPEKIPFES
jgi:2-polyprenyl-3-methyl-5-hydroxy-6-metoxy-1,4-benzoquinol methylase